MFFALPLAAGHIDSQPYYDLVKEITWNIQYTIYYMRHVVRVVVTDTCMDILVYYYDSQQIRAKSEIAKNYDT